LGGDSGRFAPLGNAGVLRFAQNDGNGEGNGKQQRQPQHQRQRQEPGWGKFYIPTHVAMKLRHGWGTRSFGVGAEECNENGNGKRESIENDGGGM
jgi:hypothetical protein